MYDRYKKVRVVVVVAISSLLGITSANAAVANERNRMEQGVQACVAEIGKRADYGDASRVLHLVVLAERKNLVELRMKIETTVYSGQSDLVLSQYSTSCVTGALSKLVKFKMHQDATHG